MRFVIADDSRIPRDKLRAFLRHAGHVVIGEAENGRDALKLCEELKPDAAIFDISMPVMGGDLAARELLAAKTVRYVIVASSAAMDAITRPLMALGASFIAKPFHRSTLLTEIERITHGDH